ncbi:MAG: hypothetical protein U0172_09210 [Nitrospiraceae bacterium]
MCRVAVRRPSNSLMVCSHGGVIGPGVESNVAPAPNDEMQAQLVQLLLGVEIPSLPSEGHAPEGALVGASR